MEKSLNFIAQFLYEPWKYNWNKNREKKKGER